ncbi:GntR family transcriptional regulator [Dechloromonas sp. XY25]|uniref:Pyruvate dehydrogenase complex repressor n=1 Tax=Dechloromonas hankyongensis TaxID=2908002 RepID=A0ABS9K3T8_9RHOO|nr:FCD domain-containing protein [Dechloromonas hankyongensis]MCG2577846.1 GntR family transcriptional regulator [Dechloromonas hankyongensis]
MPNKVQVPRISDAIAATLERRILEGSLKPGDRLPPERELAVDLGVSRPSLREAIQKLASKGMVTSRQGGGTYVTDVLDTSFSDPWQDMMVKHPNLREDMLEFRRMLEGQAAEWAAERATAADLQLLEQTFAALMDAFESDDANKRSEADIAFHQAIGDAAHNVLIGHLSSALLHLMHDNIRLNLGELKAVPAASRLLKAQHEAIYKAVRESKPQAARSAAETHIDFVRETLAQTLRSVARRETAERRLSTDFSTS